MNKGIFFFLTAPILLSIHCGINISNNSGGGGTETTNGIVLSASGKPAPGAIVRLIDLEDWKEKKQKMSTVVLDSVVTDSKGAFSFLRDTITKCNLQIDSGEESVLLQNYSFIKSVDTSKVIRLQRSVSVQGSVANISEKPTSIELYGTSYASHINDDYSFYLPGVAPGTYPVYFNMHNDNIYMSDSISLVEGDSIYDYTLDSSSYFDIDHFDNSTFYDSCKTMLGRQTGGIWFLLNKKTLNSKDYFNYNLEKFSESDSDSYLIIKTIIPDTIPLSRGIGYTLAKDSSIDLSESFTLSFYAEGHGNLRVIFYSKYLDSTGNSDTVQFGKTIDLDSISDVEWNAVNIECDSLDLDWNNNRMDVIPDLKKALRQIYRIDFVFSNRDNNPGEPVWMILDDIAIYDF
jgi:hypothetical protein